MEKGETVDLSKLPSPLPSDSEEQQQTIVMDSRDEEKAKKLLGVPDSAPRNILEALQQRKEKYTTELAKAEEAKSNSKIRRLKRIVQQFEEAIKAHKTGRPFDLGELPTPPGFPPIPVEPTEPVQPLSLNVKPLSPIPLPTPKPAAVEQKFVKKPVKCYIKYAQCHLIHLLIIGSISSEIFSKPIETSTTASDSSKTTDGVQACSCRS